MLFRETPRISLDKVRLLNTLQNIEIPPLFKLYCVVVIKEKKKEYGISPASFCGAETNCRSRSDAAAESGIQLGSTLFA